MINRLTDIIPSPSRDCIYDIAAELDLGLCVDVGAAAGHITRRFCQVGTQQTRVVAFEPFPGNHPFFNETVKPLHNEIRLIRKAVSDVPGTSKLVVRSTVSGQEPGWENMVGYSSVGHLSCRENRASQRRGLIYQTMKRLQEKLSATEIEVEVTTIDAEFPDEVIDFLKIDVQGAEEQVLAGGSRALAEQRVKLIYIEWCGEQEIVDILSDYHFCLYDSTYFITPKTPELAPFEKIGFKHIRDLKTSVARPAYEMSLVNSEMTPIAAVNEVKKQKLGLIQTDLIAVSPAISNHFSRAVDHYLQKQQTTGTD